MKPFLACIFLLLTARPLSAQFNDSTHHRINYSASGNLNRTNDGASYLVSNILRYQYRFQRNELNSGTSYVFGQQIGNRVTNNDFNFTTDLNLYKTFPHFYYWGLGVYDKSYSLKLNNRLQAGVGIAYNFIDRRDSALLNLSDGLVYEYSELNIGDSARDLYSTVRNSVRLKFRYRLLQLLTVEGQAYYQNSLLDSRDYIIRANGSLSLRLRRWLSVTSAVNYNQLSKTGRETLLLTFGFSVDHYF